VGAPLNLYFLLLGAVAYVVWARRKPRHGHVAILLGGLGILAFILSAVSPDDDDFQHEWIRGGTSSHSRANCAKARPAHGTSTNISAVSIDNPRLTQPDGIVGRLRLITFVPSARLQARARANRAPPLPI
jgi:hypothetical protein